MSPFSPFLRATSDSLQLRLIRGTLDNSSFVRNYYPASPHSFLPAQVDRLFRSAPPAAIAKYGLSAFGFSSPGRQCFVTQRHIAHQPLGNSMIWCAEMSIALAQIPHFNITITTAFELGKYSNIIEGPTEHCSLFLEMMLGIWRFVDRQVFLGLWVLALSNQIPHEA